MKSVSVVLATYKPNIKYFEKLLSSLNNQIYKDIIIIVRDDSNDSEVFSQVSKMIKRHITNFDYVIRKNNENIGSNRTFELLTKEADGEYIAYCDQDDIWEFDKIEKLVKKIKEKPAVLCYSDLSVINETDEITSSSFRDLNSRIKHIQGNDLFRFFLSRNSVTGCSMIIKSDVAKQAIPFNHDYFVHDHWLALIASTKGDIAYVNEPLVRYRIHADNQIGASVLRGVENKGDYVSIKLKKELEKFNTLSNKHTFSSSYEEEILRAEKWTEQRIDLVENPKLKYLFKNLRFLKDDYQLTLFEIFIAYSPDFLSTKVLKKIKIN